MGDVSTSLEPKSDHVICTAKDNKDNNTSNGSGGTNFPKLSTPGYLCTSANDEKKFVDDYRQREPRKGGDDKEESKDPTTPSTNKGHNLVKSKLISTRCLENPTLKMMRSGFDLEQQPSGWCSYYMSWNLRSFAHNLSSDFSSGRIWKDDTEHVGMVDFMGDWRNIKSLLKSHTTETHLSYVLHRVGHSVSVDQLDIIGIMLFPGFLQLPAGFIDFIKKVVGDIDRGKIMKEGKSNKEVLDREAFNKLLHFSMETPIKLARDPSGVSSGEPGFLSHVMLCTEKFKILVGSDIPIFEHKDLGITECVTVRACDAAENQRWVDADDMWLDNILMGSSSTVVSRHKGWNISETDWITNDELPSVGKFVPTRYLEHGENLLSFINENVKEGDSYWLYRAPGSYEVTLYNVSNIRTEASGTYSPEPIWNFGAPAPSPDYVVAATLMKHADVISEAILTKLSYEGFGHGNSNYVRIVSHKEKQLEESTYIAKCAELNSKIEKFIAWLRKCQKFESWMLTNLDQVSADSFDKIVLYFKKVYTTSVVLAPNIRNWIYTHAVPKYYGVCSELIRNYGYSVYTGESNLYSILNDSSEDEYLRKSVMEVLTRMCEIMSCLADWHDKVTYIRKEYELAWKYVACRIYMTHADMLSAVAQKDDVRTKPIRLGEEFPENHHPKVKELYDAAFERVPSVAFAASQWSLYPLDDPVTRRSLLDKLHWKYSLECLRTAIHCLLFSTESYSQTEHVDGIERISTGALKVYEEVASLLRLAMNHAQAVDDPKGIPLVPSVISNQLARLNTMLGDVSSKIYYMSNLRVFKESNNNGFDELLNLLCDKGDNVFRLANFKLTKNANQPLSFDRGMGWNGELEFFKHEKLFEAKSYFSKATSFYEGGNIKMVQQKLQKVKDYMNLLGIQDSGLMNA